MSVVVFQVDPSPRFFPYDYEREAIAALGGELIVASCTTEQEVIEGAKDAEIALVSWKALLTPTVMKALPRLRFIVRWGVGYDMIDVDAATEHGIAVANAPTYCTQDVAEHAMSLLFAIARRITWAHERMREGAYIPPSGPIHRLTERTLGIVGCGRIGSAVAKRALGVGMRVVAYDKYRSAAELEALGMIPVSFDQLLQEANYITLHVPLNAETRKLIDARAISLMQPDTMIVNTSRGPVIDQDALVEALNEGRLAGAGLDVFEQEPLAADHPLRSLEYVMLTPHAAAFTVESLGALREEMVDTVATWIRDGWSDKVVNPEVRSKLRAKLALV